MKKGERKRENGKLKDVKMPNREEIRQKGHDRRLKMTCHKRGKI